jgi:hypothetical protein
MPVMVSAVSGSPRLSTGTTLMTAWHLPHVARDLMDELRQRIHRQHRPRIAG